MLKTYTLRDLSGETDTQVATRSSQARELSRLENGVAIGWQPQGQQCGGDCGDCNDARKCPARGQAL